MMHRDGSQVVFEAIHDGAECSGNTVYVYNINLVIDKDADIQKLTDAIRDIAKNNPISVVRGGR